MVADLAEDESIGPKLVREDDVKSAVEDVDTEGEIKAKKFEEETE